MKLMSNLLKVMFQLKEQLSLLHYFLTLMVVLIIIIYLGTLVDTTPVFFDGLKKLTEIYNVPYDSEDQSLRQFCLEKVATCHMLDMLERVLHISDANKLLSIKKEFKNIQEPLYNIPGETVSFHF